MANALTAVRLALVLPSAAAFARPDFLAPVVVVLLLCVAITADFLDGRVARTTGTASVKGQLFDHGTDCLFVTGGLTGAALSGSVTPLLPALIPVAFGQYVIDSYVCIASGDCAPAFSGGGTASSIRPARSRRGIAHASPGCLWVVPAAGGGCARVFAGRFNGGIDD